MDAERIARIQEIFNKFDAGDELTPEERNFWKGVTKEEKQEATGMFSGTNMNMQQNSIPDNIEPQSHDYSDKAPETSPKDLESEKVFNPTQPGDQNTSDYDTLVMAVQKLKDVGVSPNEIKKALKSGDSYDKDKQINMPVWDSEGMNIVDHTSMSIDRVIDDLAGKQLTKKQIAASEAAVKKSQRAEDKLHQQRMNALPKNQKQSAAEQSRITEGYKNEINPDKSDEAAVLERQPSDYVEVQNLDNLLKDSPEPGYADSLRKMIVNGKSAGKSFNTILTKDFGASGVQKLLRMVGKDKEKADKVLDYLESIYNNEKTDIKDDIKQKLDTKETRALNAGKRAEDKLVEALQNKESPDELPSDNKDGKNYSASAKRFNNGPKTEYQRILSGDKNQQLDQAIKDAIQAPKAVENLLQDGALNKILDSVKSKYSKDFWLKYFKDNPYLSFRITPDRSMLKDATLRFVGEREGHGNGGKEDSFNLLSGDDIDNFVTAYNEAQNLNALKREAMKKYNKSFKSVGNDDNFAPINTPKFNYVSASGTDAQEDAEFRARLEKMLETNDKRWMYQDPGAGDTVMTWDPETGLFTENKISDAIKAKKEHKSGYTINDNYYNHLLNALGSDYSTLQEALDYASGGSKEGNTFNTMESDIRDKFGNDSATKAKELFKDILAFNDVLSGGNMNKLDGSSKLRDALTFGGALSPTLIRQLQNKFGAAREKNPDKQLKDMLTSGDLYDVLTNTLGYNINEKLDPRWYTPYVSAVGKLDKYARARQKERQDMIDPVEVKKWLLHNSKAVKEALKSGDYSKLGKDLDELQVKAIDGELDDALSLLFSDKDIDQYTNRLTNHTEDSVNGLPSIADLQKDKFDDLSAELDTYKEELADLIKANEGKADTPDIIERRNYVKELGDELARMKYERMPIRELADSDFGGDYHKALQSYLNPEVGDDLDSWYNQIINKKGFKSKLKALKASHPDKFAAIASILRRLGETYPDSFPGINDQLANLDSYVEPMKIQDILKSQDMSSQWLGLTPDEYSAVINNKLANASANQSKSLRRHPVGQGKSRGSMGSDAYARMDKVADIIQKAENTGTTDKLLDEVGHKDSQKLADAKQGFNETTERLKNALKDIFA